MSTAYCTPSSIEKKYKDNLTRTLPRIPPVSNLDDFRKFSVAGRDLGKLHADFDEVDPYPVTIEFGESAKGLETDPNALYRVEKMKFVGGTKNKDMSGVAYNDHITVTDIPLEAYEYVVNGKSALYWVMKGQCVKTDKDSGIVDDANLYAIETMGDPAYPLELFKRVITVSIETMKIVRGLPNLDID